MDLDAELKKLEDERDYIREYLSHPITAGVLADGAVEQEKAINMICNVPVDSLGAFFSHFELVGHLRGLRRMSSLFQDQLADVEEKIAKLQKEYGTGN